MSRCPTCASEVPEGQSFCGNCGTLVDSSSAPTQTRGEVVPPATGRRGDGGSPIPTGAGSHPSLDEARFLPGTMVAQRYRIVGMLGRGGMGEVYRADDLKLGQPVALKFLPEDVQRDSSRLERFLNEVRVSLKVTHPNVCRVYDIGEVEGRHYLSMEYVDGEDLASLLRRIGRLPEDKAVQIARQVCAGLAAAHDEGVLHRDLKPANVMIDGRGRAKITDFGLASLAEVVEGDEVRVGTPGYMAPEQIAGKHFTVKSDLYSLGLVLYELFTGKRAFDARTPAELLRLERESEPTSPRSHVSGLDAAVERAILHCLEREPTDRPASAPAVSAALPGGDPLAAALAAGETPSPEMVAQAGDSGGLKPSIAIACLAFVLVAVGLIFVVAKNFPDMGGLIGRVPLEKPPLILERDAQEILARLGHDAPAVSRAHGFSKDLVYLDHIERTDPSLDRWDRLANDQPAAVYFWYRQSPRQMTPESRLRTQITATDPPRDVSGMAQVSLDGAGRLLTLRVIPPQYEESEDPAPEPDWPLLFETAGLDIAVFTEVEPRWVPLDYADRRAAWVGKRPFAPEFEVRIEAAAYRGKPTCFAILESWDRPMRMEESALEQRFEPANILVVTVILAIVVGAVLLARRNLRLGRGDTRGATRLALAFGVAVLLDWLLTADHVPDFNDEIGTLISSLAVALMLGSATWLVYVALEPFLRRRWPGALVSWNRLLAGRFADPLVGRDILAGSVMFSALLLLEVPYRLAPRWLGIPAPNPAFAEGADTSVLLGVRFVASHIGSSAVVAVMLVMGLLFLLLLLRVVLRNQWMAFAAFVVILALPAASVFGLRVMAFLFPLQIVTWCTFLFVLSRFGMLSVCVWMFAAQALTDVPSYDLTTWYSSATLAIYGAFVLITLYGFYISLAGRPIFATDLVPQE